jgi:CopG family nickel-responsive transcriptional regulator
MSKIERFTVSIEEKLLREFERFIVEEGYPTRSEAIKSLIRDSLIRQEWKVGKKEVAGAITLVYDHHKRGLVDKLMDVQHDFPNLIISTQHIHLDQHNCLEIVVIRGKPADINNLVLKLKSVKGLKHSHLIAATTGKEIH